MFTTIEGDWDSCLAVVRDAVEAVGRYGSRVSLVLKADIRAGHSGGAAGPRWTGSRRCSRPAGRLGPPMRDLVRRFGPARLGVLA